MPATDSVVSIIMPAFNAERYIKPAIQSILDQTYQHWELIIINDGSSDNTLEQINEFKDERIKLIDLPHMGNNNVARQKGLDQCMGLYIAFLDADDLYLPDSLSIRLNYLNKNADCDAVYGFYQMIDEQGRPKVDYIERLIPEQNGWRIHESATHTWENIILGKVPTYLQGLMIRRSVLDKVRFLSEGMVIMQDHVFFVNLFHNNFNGIHALSHPVFKYRVYSDSVTYHPAGFERKLDSLFNLFNYIFTDPRLPKSIWNKRSNLCLHSVKAHFYRHFKGGHPSRARRVLYRSWFCPLISKAELMNNCLLLYVRTFIPGPINQMIGSFLKRA